MSEEEGCLSKKEEDAPGEQVRLGGWMDGPTVISTHSVTG